MHGRGVIGQHEGGGVHLGDDRRPGDDVAGAQPCAVVDPGLDPFAVDPDRGAGAQGIGHLLGVAVLGVGRHVGSRAVRRGPHGDELVLGVEDEGEEPLVLGVEGRAQRPQPAAAAVEGVDVDRDRDLEALAVVAQVGGVGDDVVLVRHALGGEGRPRVRCQLVENLAQARRR